jgi:prepilin-type N-terminal cleavage/methylation domain-containing protein
MIIERFKKTKISRNYKGVSLIELMVALSIFALIAMIGFSAFSFMLNTQYKNQLNLEKKLFQQIKIYSCIKKFNYEYEDCKANSSIKECDSLTVTSSCDFGDFEK